MLRRLLLLALTAAALAARLSRLLESPHPLGTDGYYYVVQVERLLSTGRLHAPDGSWTLYALAFAAWPFRDPVVGVKVGEALLAALCVPAAFLAGRRLSQAAGAVEGTPSGWLLAFWAAASPSLSQLAGEFPKNVGLVAPALLALGLAAEAKSKGSLALAATAGLLAALAHRTGAALVLLGMAGAGAGLALRGIGSSRRATLAWISLAAGACAAFALFSALLPNLLQPADLERLSGQFQLALSWPPPAAYFALRPPPFALALELLLSWPAALLGVVAWALRPALRPVLGALLFPLAAALFPFWRRDVLDVGYRLSLLLPILSLPLLLTAAPALLGWRPVPIRLPRSARAVLALGLLLLASWISSAGIRTTATPPFDRYRRLIAALPRPLPDLVIAHQGLSFYYDHLTGKDAMAWAPEPELDRSRVGRITWGVLPGEWKEWGALPGAPPPLALDRDYAYVREDVWEALVARARAADDDDALSRIGDWRNPGQVRPRFLSRNRGR